MTADGSAADGYVVDTEGLAGRAGQFEGLVTRLGEIRRDLTDALASTGRCWGTDAVGQSFDQVHTTPADGALARLTALPEQVGSVGGRLSETAATYRSDDESGAGRLRAAEQ